MSIRRSIFRVVAFVSAIAFLNLGGITSIFVPWGSAGFPFPDFTPELHRWHSALLGVSEAILFPGLLLALVFRPTHIVVMQFFILAGIGLVLPHLLIRGSTPISSLFILLPIITFPSLKSLFHFPRIQRLDRSILWAGIFTAIALAPDIIKNFNAQLSLLGPEHGMHGHWATALSLDLVLIFGILLSSMRSPGWLIVISLCAISFMYLGIAAITLPFHAGSWGVIGGIIALTGGAALLFIVFRSARISARQLDLSL